jgi:hypothetical protein
MHSGERMGAFFCEGGAVASESARRSSEEMEKRRGRVTSCSAGCSLDLDLGYSLGQLEAEAWLGSSYLN